MSGSSCETLASRLASRWTLGWVAEEAAVEGVGAEEAAVAGVGVGEEGAEHAAVEGGSGAR